MSKRETMSSGEGWWGSSEGEEERMCWAGQGAFLGGKWAGKGEGATGDGGRSSQAAGTPAAKGL